MKKIVSMFLAVLMVLTIIPLSANRVSASSIEDNEVFFKQKTSYTCTLSAAAMMLRRTAILKGVSSWKNITETSIKSTAWIEDQGLINNFSYTLDGVKMTVTTGKFSGTVATKKEKLISLLITYPQGIVIYNTSQRHAVLLTKYDSVTDTFYCADPWTGTASGQIKLSESIISGSSVDKKIDGLTKYWYVKSPTVSISSNKTLTINYNANGGAIAPDVLYKVSTGGVVLRLRASTSTSSEVLTTIADGTTIKVEETKTANGYTWAKTTHNNKTGWCAIKSGSEPYAVRTGYYLNSSIIYKYETSSANTQLWTYGTTKTDGLVNASTFKLSRDGYSFVGWSASPDGSTTVFDQNDATLKAEDICPELKDGSKTIMLYAIWKENISPITGISISKVPDKQVYKMDETFDPAGMEITVQYENGSSKTITEGFQLEYEFSNPGYVSVEVIYEGVSAWTSVLVYEEPAVEPMSAEGYTGQTVTIPLGYFSNVQESIGAMSFSATLTYDSTKLQYKGFVDSGELNSSRMVINSATDGTIYIAYADDKTMPTDCILVELQFAIIGTTAETYTMTVDSFELYDSASRSYTVTTYPGTVTNYGPVIVSFDTQGGTNVPQAITGQYGQMIALPQTIPTRDGYVFLGWSSDITENSIDYFAGDTIVCEYTMTLYAVWEESITIDPNAPQIIVESVSGIAGETLTVTVSLKNNPGFGGMAYTIGYDNTILELISYELGLGSAICTDSGIDTYPNEINFQYAGVSNITGDGALVTLTFKIKDSAEIGTTTITVTPEEGTSFYYEGRTEIDFELFAVNGIVEIIEYIKGDINGDGKVNNRDAARLMQYLAGWDVDYVSAALDVNGDNKINNRDAARLMQYLAGWDVEIN